MTYTRMRRHSNSAELPNFNPHKIKRVNRPETDQIGNWGSCCFEAERRDTIRTSLLTMDLTEITVDIKPRHERVKHNA